MHHTYTINDMIVFDSILGTLRSVQDSDEVIYLNNPVSRCLQLLIERQGQVIPHEDFLYYVWEQYGLHVSINNFYQNISLLRKAISATGAREELIITVPKHGVLLPERYTVISHASNKKQLKSDVISDISKSDIITNRSVQSDLEFNPKQRGIEITPKSIILSRLLFGIIVTLVFFYGIDIYNNKVNDFSFQYFYFGKSENNCSLYFNKDENNYNRHYDVIRKLDIHCGLYSNESDYFYLYVTAYNNFSDVSVFQCNKPMLDYGSICMSRYYPAGV